MAKKNMRSFREWGALVLAVVLLFLTPRDFKIYATFGMVVAYGLGVYAVVPNLLRRAGVPHDVCEGWYMNVFLLSSLLNRLVQGGTIYGPFVMGTLIAAQYAVLLLAIRRIGDGKNRR